MTTTRAHADGLAGATSARPTACTLGDTPHETIRASTAHSSPAEIRSAAIDRPALPSAEGRRVAGPPRIRVSATLNRGTTPPRVQPDPPPSAAPRHRSADVRDPCARPVAAPISNLSRPSGSAIPRRGPGLLRPTARAAYAARRSRTEPARSRSAISVVSQPMQASVIDWPKVRRRGSTSSWRPSTMKLSTITPTMPRWPAAS